MHRNIISILVLAFFSLVVSSCHTAYQSQLLQYKSYRITPDQSKDSAILSFLQPYSDSVNNSMNGIIGYATMSMDKIQPESSLGNFVVDALYFMAKEKYNTHVDAAFVNFGGIRLSQLSAGAVTRGKIFEIMPFDNLLILQKVKGTVLQSFLDLTASRGGWPIAGIKMQIKDKKATAVYIQGELLNPEKMYTIVNSDFVANGGDNAEMLKSIPQISNGYLMRDAIFDYIAALRKQGKKIAGTIENRVVNAN